MAPRAGLITELRCNSAALRALWAYCIHYPMGNPFPADLGVVKFVRDESVPAGEYHGYDEQGKMRGRYKL
jgi:hypothetical protein